MDNLRVDVYVRSRIQPFKQIRENMFNLTATWLIAAYIFINAIPYTPAARYSLLGALLVLAVIGLAQKHFGKAFRSPVTLGLALFVNVALLSALNSPYLVDSLQGFRKDYLPPLFVLLVATSLKQTAAEKQHFAKTILWALIGGYAVKTCLALWDGAVNHPFIFSPYSNPEFFEKNGLPKYVSYYAVESVLYLTLTYSALVFLCSTWAKRVALLLLLGTSFFILLVSGIRSAFAAALIGLLVITLFKLRTPKRIAGLFLALFIIVGGTLVIGKNNTEVTRYVDLVKAERYSKQEGMSGRYPIWEGVAELLAKRPLLGFGPGWQKIPTAAKDTGLITAWQSDYSNYGHFKSWYFSLDPGKVNPHNLTLQVLFETGWIGFLAYLTMLATLFWKAFTTAARSKTPLTQWLKFSSVAYFTALFVIDITNAFLIHNTMVALMLITVLLEQSTFEASKSKQQ